jgi:hypothetical protein
MSHVLRKNGSHHGGTSVLVGALVAWGVAFLLLWGVLIFFAAVGGAYDPRTTLLMCLPFTLLLVKVIQWWRQGRSRLWVVPFKWAGVGVFWPLWVVAAFSRNFRSSLTPRKPALHCPACGSTVAADASYCTHCGAKLEPE